MHATLIQEQNQITIDSTNTQNEMCVVYSHAMGFPSTLNGTVFERIDLIALVITATATVATAADNRQQHITMGFFMWKNHI